MTARRVFAVLAALILVAVCAAPSSAQQRQLTKDQVAQYQALHALVDAVSSGKQPAPADVKLTLHNYFLNTGTDVYIPLTLDLQGTFSMFPVGMYVRAVSKAAPAAPAADAGRGGRGGDAARGGGGGRAGGRGRLGGAPAGGASYAFEDVAFYTAAMDHVDRALELAPGDYDVYFAMAEMPAPPSKDKKAPPPPAPKATVLVVPLTVPNLMSGLTTSSVILAKNLEPATSQPNGQQQLEQPYTISGIKVEPNFAATFSKTGELLWVFYIYNEGVATTGKPDVEVEYNFYRAAEEKPFTHLQNGVFNATTLPPEFSLAAGHQVFAATGVPLATFAPGDYKFEIKVTDKTNSQSLTKVTPFTVTP